MSKRLYRYISFEDFVNLAVNNKDRFVRPCVWDDKYEGYLFSHMESREDVRHIVNEMYYHFCLKNYDAIVDNYFKMWHSKWHTYAQCWSVHKETDAMWRCYSCETGQSGYALGKTNCLIILKRFFQKGINLTFI